MGQRTAAPGVGVLRARAKSVIEGRDGGQRQPRCMRNEIHRRRARPRQISPHEKGFESKILFEAKEKQVGKFQEQPHRSYSIQLKGDV